MNSRAEIIGPGPNSAEPYSEVHAVTQVAPHSGRSSRRVRHAPQVPAPHISAPPPAESPGQQAIPPALTVDAINAYAREAGNGGGEYVDVHPDTVPPPQRSELRTGPVRTGADPAGDDRGSSSITSLQRRLVPPRGRHATSYGQNFARVVGWTLLGSLLPGTGLIAAGRRTAGLVAVTLASLLVSVGVTFAIVGDPFAVLSMMVSRPDRFLVLAVALVVGVLAWAAMVISTHSSLRRFANLGAAQRVVCSLLVCSLIGLVAVPAAKTASYAVILRDTLTGIFTSQASTTANGAGPNSNSADPWANTARINVLLIGSDAGADRIGIRPDTLILASINTQTGDTVLFSLPRNLQKVPFPPGTEQAAEYPYGYDCVDGNGAAQCLLNAFWTFGEEHWKTYYDDEPDAFNAGLRATSEAVEQVTGLPVDQYAMLNLRGFMQFVDAIGGITVDVQERLPIGGSSDNPYASDWIEAGPNQLLDGYNTLWYARSRWSTDDYDRMRRQRCVIGAVIEQADPATVALAFPKIAKAAKTNITTGIPLADLGAWVELTQKVKGAQVRSLPFTTRVINPADPDIAAMRSMVAEAIKGPVKPSASTAPSSKPSSKPSTEPSTPSSRPSPSPSEENPEQAQDIASVC